MSSAAAPSSPNSTASTCKPSPLPSTNPSVSFWHTEPSPLLLGHRTTRNLPESADIVVVGSGITGASVAWHLLGAGEGEGKGEEGGNGGEGEGERKAGPSVVMLEAREACWGATGRNGGHCAPTLYEHPTDPSIGYFELSNHAALSALTATHAIPCEFHPNPSIRGLYSTADLAGARASLETLAKHGPALAAQCRLVTDADELKELRVPTALGAVVSRVAARMWPYRFVAWVLERLLLLTDERAGGRFNLQTGTAVTELRRSRSNGDDDDDDDDGKDPQQGHGGWDVVTPRGVVRARKVVLATNAYTSHLLPEYADLIVPVRGQMSALVAPAPQVVGAERLATSFGFIGQGVDDYLVQRGSTLAGGGSEQLMFGGGRAFGPSLGVADDEEVDGDVARHLKRALVGYLGIEGVEGEELEASHMWTGIMGFSRDNKPLVGHVPGMKGVLMSAGYTGHGMPNAWLCGAAVAIMALDEGSESGGCEAALEATGLPRAYLLSEERFAEARAGETVAEQDWRCGFRAERCE